MKDIHWKVMKQKTMEYLNRKRLYIVGRLKTATKDVSLIFQPRRKIYS